MNRRERQDKNVKDETLTDVQVIPYYCNDNKLWKLRGYREVTDLFYGLLVVDRVDDANHICL